MSAVDDLRLMGIAREVADGREVDWDGVRQQLEDEASDAVLSDLQAVEQIAAFHRSDGDSIASTASISEAPIRSPRHLETSGAGREDCGRCVRICVSRTRSQAPD